MLTTLTDLSSLFAECGISTNILNTLFIMSAVYLILLCSGLLTKNTLKPQYQLCVYVTSLVLAIIETGVAIIGICKVITASYLHASQWGSVFDKMMDVQRTALRTDAIHIAETYAVLFILVICIKVVEGTINFIQIKFTLKECSEDVDKRLEMPKFLKKRETKRSINLGNFFHNRSIKLF